jgi:hypothetical protein
MDPGENRESGKSGKRETVLADGHQRNGKMNSRRRILQEVTEGTEVLADGD